MTLQRNNARSRFRYLFDNYWGTGATGATGSPGGFGRSTYISYLYLLGYQPVGFDQDRTGGFGFGTGLGTSHYWYDAKYNPWIHRAVDLKATLVFGGEGIRLEAENSAVMDMWQLLARLSRPSAQMTYEKVRQVEGSVYLGIYPLPERGMWGVKRYSRQDIHQVHTEGGQTAAYTLHDSDTGRLEIIPDIDYQGLNVPERIICVSDAEDPSVYAESSLSAAIEPARRLYMHYLDWSHMSHELARLGWTWEHDPQTAGVSEPEFDSDSGFLMGQQIPRREGSMPTGARIVQTAGQREGMGKAHELLLAVAAATDLTDMDFGDSRSGNRANAETLERSKRLKLRFHQVVWMDAYTRILNHILPPSAEWSLHIEPLEDIDTVQRTTVISQMLDDGLISVETAARLALPLVGVDDVAGEILKLAEEGMNRPDFGDFDTEDDDLPPGPEENNG